jgi:glycine/D-amino acid oxidase-like deaminating enzyme
MITSTATFAQSNWFAVYDEPAVPEDMPGDANLIIIGGGVTGLSAALQMGQVGRSVSLFDVGLVGYGASGRNGACAALQPAASTGPRWRQ